MVGKPTKLFSKQPIKSQEVQHSLFRKRQAQRGVNWTDVNYDNFVMLLSACVRENIGIGIYSASGGRGICLKLYTGKKQPDVEYAGTAEEFDDLVAGVLDSLGETVDDLGEEEAAD